MRAIFRSTIAQNALALYGVQGATLLLPLATLPYLARVLRPEAWGMVVLSQAVSVWLAMVLHYGFAFSATREAARRRDDPARLSALVAGVMGGKLILLLLVAVVAAAALAVMPVFRQSPRYLAWAVVTAVLQGFNPLWYFQGVERMKAPAVLDVAARALATAGVFVLVAEPSDGWMVLALQAAAAALTTSIALGWMYREVAWRPFRLVDARTALREGWPLFVFTGAASAYTTANSILLGLMAPPQVVSFYGAAEKVARAASSLLSPISQSLYPRMSHLVATNRAQAIRLVRRSLWPIVGLGLLLGSGIAVTAPFIVRLLFGPGYEPVVSVLRVLSAIPLLLGIGTVLGIQWVIPLGMERTYNRLVIGAALVGLLLAVVLAPRYGALGMAVVAVVAEGVVEAGLLWLVLRPNSAWRNAGRTATIADDRFPAATGRL